MKRSRLFAIALAVGLLGAGLGVGSALMIGAAPRDPNPQLARATALYGVERPVPAMALTDHHGKRFEPARFKGRWSLLFFGYTYCPDVCPATLSAAAGMRTMLRDPALRGRLDVYFVSVDPERDTPERLGQYVTFFDPSFVGLTGTRDELDQFTRVFGTVYRVAEHAAGSQDYLVDHSTGMLLVDPLGRFSAVFSSPHEPQVLARDLETIVAAYRAS